MQVYGPNGVHQAHSVPAPHFRAKPAQQAASGGGSDRVEISAAAQEASRLAEASTAASTEPGSDAPIRTELVARLRSQIAAGGYDTPDRLDAALERVLDRLS